MEKIVFKDLPDTSTPLNAQNLNAIQDNAETAMKNLVESSDIKSWTPTIGAFEETNPTVTYTTQSGKYIRLGNMVYIEFYIRGQITALNGTYNYAAIKSLPFYNVSSNYGEQAFSIGCVYGLLNNPSGQITMSPYNGSRAIKIQQDCGSTAAQLKVTTTSYFEVAGSGWYRTEDE